MKKGDKKNSLPEICGSEQASTISSVADKSTLDMKIIYFPQKVNTYLIKKYIAKELLQIPQYFRVHVECRYLADKNSKISQMRARVIAGQLPSNTQKGGIQGKNDTGEGKNTKEPQKTSTIDYISRLRGQNKEEWQKSSEIGGINMVNTIFMEKFIREMAKRCTYEYKRKSTGLEYMKQGAIWHGKNQHWRTKTKFLKAWHELKPMMKEAYLVTIKEPNNLKGGTEEERLITFNSLTKVIERQWRQQDGLAIFSALEWTNATGWHRHLILVSCEEDYPMLDVIKGRMSESVFSSSYDRKKWNIEDEPEYLLKTITPNTEKMLNIFDSKKGEIDIYMKESFVVWYSCYLLNIRQFSHPSTTARGAEKILESAFVATRRQKMEKIAQRQENAHKAHILEKMEMATSSTDREQAKNAFIGTECEKCTLKCGVGDWLRQYVFVDNSIQYKELKDFLEEYDG